MSSRNLSTLVQEPPAQHLHVLPVISHPRQVLIWPWCVICDLAQSTVAFRTETHKLVLSSFRIKWLPWLNAMREIDPPLGHFVTDLHSRVRESLPPNLIEVYEESALTMIRMAVRWTRPRWILFKMVHISLFGCPRAMTRWWCKRFGDTQRRELEGGYGEEET